MGVCVIIPPKDKGAWIPISTNFKNIDPNKLMINVNEQNFDRVKQDKSIKIISSSSLSKFIDQSHKNKQLIFKGEASVKEIEKKYFETVRTGTKYTTIGSEEITTPSEFTYFPTKKELPVTEYAFKWNLKVLRESNCFMQRHSKERLEKGEHDTIVNFGSVLYSYNWTIEQDALYLLEYLHYGDPKIWYVVPPQYLAKAEELLNSKIGSSNSQVKVVNPSFLLENKIPVYRYVQEPGQFIILLPFTIYAKVDTGFNCSEKLSVCFPNWYEIFDLVCQYNKKNHLESTFDYGRALINGCMSEQALGFTQSLLSTLEKLTLKNEEIFNKLKVDLVSPQKLDLIKFKTCFCGKICINFYCKCSCNGYLLCHDHACSYCTHGPELKKAYYYDLFGMVQTLENDVHTHQDHTIENIPVSRNIHSSKNNFNKRENYCEISILDQVLLKLCKENVKEDTILNFDKDSCESFRNSLIFNGENVTLTIHDYYDFAKNSGACFEEFNDVYNNLNNNNNGGNNNSITSSNKKRKVNLDQKETLKYDREENLLESVKERIVLVAKQKEKNKNYPWPHDLVQYIKFLEKFHDKKNLYHLLYIHISSLKHIFRT
eukprot:TRINITY_DN6971_c0_g1_i1.p1 TRINITY_DN6971_c0_g1~~TRINITY_DN6971_c0_g1_i1.p1  ORF type:complete len:600 (-),score=121.11 TRINITY_DN6971_c0_g1_i1:27-1826(-)